MTVFLDTSVIVAWVNEEDEQHERAVALMGRVVQGEWGVPILIDHILDETLTVLMVRVGRLDFSRRFIEEFVADGARRLPLRGSTLQDLKEAIALHLRVFDRSLSITDCLLVVHANAARGVVATFDDGLHGLVACVPD